MVLPARFSIKKISISKEILLRGGCIAEVAFLLLTQQPRVRFSAFLNFFDVPEIYRRHWLEKSGQRLENVDRTHLVLASGKPVLQETRRSIAPTIYLNPSEGTWRKRGSSQEGSSVGAEEEKEEEEALVPADCVVLRHLRPDLQVRDPLRAAHQGARGEARPQCSGLFSGTYYLWKIFTGKVAYRVSLDHQFY